MTNTFDEAMKRFLVRSAADGGPGRSGQQALGTGYQSRLERPNHKIVLRNGPGPYN